MNYEELIKRIKKAAEGDMEDDWFGVALRGVAPELFESEDERIRKWLIEYVKRETGFTYQHFPSQTQVLVWLEKQKTHEENMVEENYYLDEDGGMFMCVLSTYKLLEDRLVLSDKRDRDILDNLNIEKEWLAKRFRTLTPWNNQDWNKEDSINTNSVIQIITDAWKNAQIKELGTTKFAPHYYEDLIDWLKSLCHKFSVDLKPYYIEGRGIFIPVINKVLDMKDLSDEPMTWNDATALAKEKGKELFSLKESRIITYFYDEINELLNENGGKKLELKSYWTSEADEKSAWFVYLNNGTTYNSNRHYHNYVRAVSAL